VGQFDFGSDEEAMAPSPKATPPAVGRFASFARAVMPSPSGASLFISRLLRPIQNQPGPRDSHCAGSSRSLNLRCQPTAGWFRPAPIDAGASHRLEDGAHSMGFNCGIVGLPNVGKSTLFNALTATIAAQAANYPFCTIEPNVGRVAVPDPRLDKLAALAKSAQTIPTQLEFVDIAGLVRGASRGEGLGNQFLGNIREVDAIVHVLRCFTEGDVTHVEGSVDPVRDAETVETELMLADLDSLEKREIALAKRARGADKEAIALIEVVTPILTALRAGQPARSIKFTDTAKPLVRSLQLLTAKPVLYVCNVDEAEAATGNQLARAVEARARAEGAAVVIISAAIEAEVAQLASEAERLEFLGSLGLAETGLSRVIRAGYGLLDLVTFFTVGPKEARAWTVRRGAKAPEAAGVIHTDFEKGFIRAETIAYEDYVRGKGEAGAREAGKFRLEGKDYVVQDGDVLHFRFAN
jgi:GTP-binding protein YchF